MDGKNEEEQCRNGISIYSLRSQNNVKTFPFQKTSHLL